MPEIIKHRSRSPIVAFLLMVMLFTISFSRQAEKATLTGQVSDSETGNSLENVIIFLSNTPLGTSTGKDGKFVLAGIPPGKYELVISRVGYERQTYHIRLEKPDSIHYDIKLNPQPVQTKGVEVLSQRAGEAKLNLLFPKAEDDSYCVYGSGASQPIGILFTDSALYMYSLEPTVVDSEKYIRLWLLYKNTSQKPYDFDPVADIKLDLRNNNYLYRDISPDLPTEIQMRIKKEDAAATLQEVISSMIHRMAGQQNIFLSHELYFLRNLLTPEQYAHYVTNDVVRGSLSGIAWDNLLLRSVNDGILSRHIVCSGNSVQGFIFFPFPGLDWKTSNDKYDEAFNREYRIELMTPTGRKIIVFTPN